MIIINGNYDNKPHKRKRDDLAALVAGDALADAVEEFIRDTHLIAKFRSPLKNRLAAYRSARKGE